MATTYEELKTRFSEFVNTETGANVVGAYIGVTIGTALDGAIENYMKPATDAKRVLDRIFIKFPTAFGFFILGGKLTGLLRWGAYGASLGVQLSLIRDIVGYVIPSSVKAQLASAVAGKLKVGQLVSYEELTGAPENVSEELKEPEIPIQIQEALSMV